jgi:CBS domain-containing protein
MRVKDVMTVGVVTAAPDSPIREVAQLMLRTKVSGLPVLDEGRLVGIVSESDILPLREGAPGRRVQMAADVMTREVITLVEEMGVTEAARVLERHGIKRAPVTRGERLVGIVSRADLLRPYLRRDSEILAEIEHGVLAHALALDLRDVRALVSEGVVHLEGKVASERDRALLARLVRSIDGVVDVDDGLEVVSPGAVA